jgi:methylenetetrahydrofolate dehydrogenase (NADP+)/methenyltetrahydrofolate cyclohydrolase
MILQLPLDTERPLAPEVVSELLEKIPPEKDADGLHSYNQGKLFTGESTPDKWTHPIPATPLGVYRLLEYYKIDPSGMNVTVIGRSRLVGMPVAVIMAHKQGTVTVCNRQTKNLAEKTRAADLLIVAAGKRHLILPEHIKNDAILVDVGIHVLEDKKITGDIHPDCFAKAKAYSPVPGGVGPMTVASLMENTFRLRLSKIA